MKCLMENWRRFVNEVESERIFEDHDYITGVLGVELPLSESGQVVLDENKKTEIIQEL